MGSSLPYSSHDSSSFFFHLSELAETIDSYSYSPTALFADIPPFVEPSDEAATTTTQMSDHGFHLSQSLTSDKPNHQHYASADGDWQSRHPYTSASIPPPSTTSSSLSFSHLAEMRRMKCSVCGQAADGFHFNALSCAACGAFFRRSIADQKTYSCATRDCDILRKNFRI